YSIRAVAAQLGIDRRTVRRYLNASECPLPKPRGKRSSILDPYRAYILTRWPEGCHNAAALYREIVGQGFQGGITIVKDFVKTLRSRSASEPVIRHVRLGPKRLRRWFAHPPEKLCDEERRLLGLVLDASPGPRPGKWCKLGSSALSAIYTPGTASNSRVSFNPFRAYS